MNNSSITNKPFFFVLIFMTVVGMCLMIFASLVSQEPRNLDLGDLSYKEIIEVDGHRIQKLSGDEQSTSFLLLSDSVQEPKRLEKESEAVHIITTNSSIEMQATTLRGWRLDDVPSGIASQDFIIPVSSDDSKITSKVSNTNGEIVGDDQIRSSNYFKDIKPIVKKLGKDILGDSVKAGPLLNQSIEEPAQLNVWVTYNDEQFRIYKRLVKDFENRHNVQIKIFRIPFQGQGEKIMYACSSRMAPDIARMDIGLIAKFAAGKALMPLDELGLKEFQSELLDAALDAGRVYLPNSGVRSYAVPDEFTTLALYYNKEMFSAAGLDPDKPPTTWSEFVEYAKRLTIDKNGDGRIDQYGFAMQITPWWSMPFLFSFKGQVLDEETMQCKLTDSGAIKALQFQLDLSQKYMVEGGAWRSGAISPDLGFKNKIYAMILNGPWNLKYFKNANIPFGVSLIPGNPELGIRSRTNVGGNANVIFRSTKSPRLAMKFLKYLASSNVQQIWMEELGAIPINKITREIAVENRKVDKNLLTFMEQATFAEGRPKIPGYDKIDRIVTKEMETAFSGDRNPREAMGKACRSIKEIIASEMQSNELDI